MSRQHCQQPDACKAKGSGHCRACNMKAKWQDPEFRERQAEATKAKWQDPEFRERQAEAVKAKWQDPEFRERQAEAVRKAHGGGINGLSPYALSEYDAARSEGFSHGDALEIAIDAEAMPKAG